MTANNPYESGLEPGLANYTPLSPLSLFRRACAVYPNKTAVVYASRRYRYREYAERCQRLASALAKRGIGLGDTVAVMAPNTPPMLEAHIAIPMIGAVINAVNYRLDSATVQFILEHAQAKVLIADREYATVVETALAKVADPPLLVAINDAEYLGHEQFKTGIDYEDFLGGGNPEHPFVLPSNEWQAISLSYTSGTTGDPKGVVGHHRGAYLNALGNALTMGLNDQSVYLWTLPMFHCNGWTYTWAVTAVGGTHVCLRQVEPASIFRLIREHRVTHLCGAPIVLNLLIHAPDEIKTEFSRSQVDSHWVEVATGGAAPPSQVIADMEAMGFRVTHLYGLTETYGPASVCVHQSDWQEQPLEQRAALMARQGVRYATMEDLMVADSQTLESVPADGKTIGEVLLRGNTVMKGYLKNPAATAHAFAGGWYHSGDLAVMHPDGYFEVKDRAKDIIISGGENISSLEIEDVLYRHPRIVEAAVVARPDPHWGETPCAFVSVKAEAPLTSEAVIAWCRERLAHYKAPKTVVFGELPKTSTGKIQKFVLREQAKALD